MGTARDGYSLTTPRPWSTAEQQQRDFWADYYPSRMFQAHTEYADETPFRLDMACQQTGRFTLHAFRQSAASLSIARTAEHVRKFPDEDYRLFCATGGSVVVATGDTEQEIQPGTAVLSTPAVPFAGCFTNNSGFTLRIPAHEINDRLNSKAPIWAGLDLRRGLGRVTFDVLRSLHEQRVSLTEGEFDAICDRLTDLICMVAAGDNRPGPDGLPEIEALVRRYVRQHAGNRELSLPAVAGGLGWSPRQVQAAMTRAGTTYRNVVRDERLRVARQMLGNPASAHQSISDIALTCGFSSGKVLSTLFKDSFEQSPRDYRYQALGQVRP